MLGSEIQFALFPSTFPRGHFGERGSWGPRSEAGVRWTAQGLPRDASPGGGQVLGSCPGRSSFGQTLAGAGLGHRTRLS